MPGNAAAERATIVDDGDGRLRLIYNGETVPSVLMLPAEHDEGAGVHLIVPGVIDALCSRDQVVRWASVLVNAAGPSSGTPAI